MNREEQIKALADHILNNRGLSTDGQIPVLNKETCYKLAEAIVGSLPSVVGQLQPLPELLQRFENGEERYQKSPLFNKMVDCLRHSIDPYALIDDLVKINDAAMVDYEKLVKERPVQYVAPVDLIVGRLQWERLPQKSNIARTKVGNYLVHYSPPKFKWIWEFVLEGKRKECESEEQAKTAAQSHYAQLIGSCLKPKVLPVGEELEKIADEALNKIHEHTTLCATEEEKHIFLCGFNEGLRHEISDSCLVGGGASKQELDKANLFGWARAMDTWLMCDGNMPEAHNILDNECSVEVLKKAGITDEDAPYIYQYFTENLEDEE